MTRARGTTPHRKRSLTEEERLRRIAEATVHYSAGLEHRRNGRLEEADAELSRAIELEAGHVHVHKDFYAQRAQIREARGDFARALSDYTQALLAHDHVTLSSADGWDLHRLEVACLRFARGLLRVHHLDDRDGGLDDLRRAAELGSRDAGAELERLRRG